MIGAATIVIATTPANAVAGCVSFHANVAGYDAGNMHYGNGGEIYVNTSTTLGNLQSGVARSLFVLGGTGNDVEVGWADNENGHGTPTVYAEWLIDGVDSKPQFYTGYTLNYNTNYRFKVQNDAHAYQFRFYVDGQTTPFNYSGYGAFNQGWAATNSEHFNSCDSMWTHMYDLSYYNVFNQWISPYEDLAEYSCDTSGNWLLNIVSNSELYVDQNVGKC